MVLHRRILAAAVFALLIGGCASGRTTSYAPPPRPLGSGLVISGGSAAEEPGGSSAPIPSRLTLADALALSMARSPELAAFSWDLRAAGARALQAGLWPNPEVGIEVENFAGSGGAGGTKVTESTLSLGQLIVLSGRLGKQRRMAELEGRLVGWDFEERRLGVFTQTARLFINALAAQERLRVSKEAAQAARQTLEATHRRVAAGRSPPAEALRAKVALSRAEIEVARTRRATQIAYRELAVLWADTEVKFEEVAGDFSNPGEPPPEEAAASLLSRNPALARWETERERAEAALELAKALAIPDPTVNVGARRLNETDDMAMVAGISAPLPLFDRNQGGRAEARARLLQSEANETAARVRLSAELSATLSRLRIAYEEARSLEGEILPAAREALEETKRGFERGRFALLDVLSAQDALFELERERVDALERYHTERAEVEGLMATPLDTLPVQQEENSR